MSCTANAERILHGLKAAAFFYAGEFGWPVFPLVAGTKIPFKGSHGYKDATTDFDQIEAWWNANPDANIGVPVGAVTGLYVVDGLEGVAEIDGFPSPTVKTPKGHHWYFKYRPGLPKTVEFPGVDCARTDGNLVLLPPSRTGGGVYNWTDPFEYSALADAPLLPGRAPPSNNNGDDKLTPGSRHVSLVTLAAKLRHDGYEPEAVCSVLLYHNDEHCDPPKPEEEVRKIAEWTGTLEGDGDKSIVYRQLIDIEPQDINWLWPNRVASGKCNLFYGDGGVGKSFALMDMMARISTGTAWPDWPDVTNEQGTVILLNAEDDPNDTIRVRCDAQGGDPSRVFIVDGVKRSKNGNDAGLSLAHDLDVIEQLATEKRARLLIVDPVTAYTGGKDIYKDDQVRDITTPLKAMAERLGMAVVLVMHTNKSATTNAKYKAANASAWINACRMAWMFAEDSGDPCRRTMTNAKNNLVYNASGLSFSFDEHDGCLKWDAEPLNKSSSQILEEQAENDKSAPRREAADWLRSALAGGSMDSKKLLALAKEDGLAEKTLRRAKKDMGIVSSPDGYGKGWKWSLPEDGQH